MNRREFGKAAVGFVTGALVLRASGAGAQAPGELVIRFQLVDGDNIQDLVPIPGGILWDANGASSVIDDSYLDAEGASYRVGLGDGWYCFQPPLLDGYDAPVENAIYADMGSSNGRTSASDDGSTWYLIDGQMGAELVYAYVEGNGLANTGVGDDMADVAPRTGTGVFRIWGEEEGAEGNVSLDGTAFEHMITGQRFHLHGGPAGSWGRDVPGNWHVTHVGDRYVDFYYEITDLPEGWYFMHLRTETPYARVVCDLEFPELHQWRDGDCFYSDGVGYLDFTVRMINELQDQPTEEHDDNMLD